MLKPFTTFLIVKELKSHFWMNPINIVWLVLLTYQALCWEIYGWSNVLSVVSPDTGWSLLWPTDFTTGEILDLLRIISLVNTNIIMASKTFGIQISGVPLPPSSPLLSPPPLPPPPSLLLTKTSGCRYLWITNIYLNNSVIGTEKFPRIACR